jgi:hypothetical protein
MGGVAEIAREAESIAVGRLTALQAESAQLAGQYSTLQEQAVLQEQHCNIVQADLDAKSVSLLVCNLPPPHHMHYVSRRPLYLCPWLSVL